MSSDVVTGIVAKLDSKAIRSKTGRTFRVHLVEMEDGTVVSVGFKQPFSIGEKVSIPVEHKFGEWKMIEGAPTPAPSSSGTTAPAKPAPYGAGRNTKFPIPKDHGDFSIIRQNALTNATKAIMDMYMINSPKRGPIEATAAEVAEQIIAMAYKFTEFSSGHREERIKRELGAGAAVKSD